MFTHSSRYQTACSHLDPQVQSRKCELRRHPSPKRYPKVSNMIHCDQYFSFDFGTLFDPIGYVWPLNIVKNPRCMNFSIFFSESYSATFDNIEYQKPQSQNSHSQRGNFKNLRHLWIISEESVDCSSFGNNQGQNWPSRRIRIERRSALLSRKRPILENSKRWTVSDRTRTEHEVISTKREWNSLKKLVKNATNHWGQKIHNFSGQLVPKVTTTPPLKTLHINQINSYIYNRLRYV